MTKPPRKTPELPSIEEMAKFLSPEARAKALLEAKIEIRTQEVVATSAIEGITIDPKEARRAVLRQMGRQAGLLP